MEIQKFSSRIEKYLMSETLLMPEKNSYLQMVM